MISAAVIEALKEIVPAERMTEETVEDGGSRRVREGEIMGRKTKARIR